MAVRSGTGVRDTVGVASGAVTGASAGESSAKVSADINVEEALSSGVYNETRSWNLNLKRTFDSYQDLDLTRARHAEERHDNLMATLQIQQNELFNQRGEMYSRRMIEFDNAMSQSNGENQRSIRTGDIASDRMWNVDEVAAMVKEILTEDQPARDAISAVIAKSLVEKASA